MLWTALLPGTTPCGAPPRIEAAVPVAAVEAETSGPAVEALATWCLQFTPRVAVVEAGSVVMETEACVRLHGGRRRLVERVCDGAAELGVGRLGWAPTSLAALACARSGVRNGLAAPLERLLDTLPLEALTAAAAQQATLARLGCRTLGDVRALPRGGLSRRFGGELLAALDRAYGLRPEVHDWFLLPETFDARLELMARVELAPALLFAARRLLLVLCGWLTARHAGITAFTLRWRHDAMNARSAGQGGELTIRTAQPTRAVEHLTRLLAEHLDRLRLDASVGEIALAAVEVQPLEEASASLLPEAAAAGESLAWVLERIAARLGPGRVLRPVVADDHRPEWMCHWQPAPEPLPGKPAFGVDMPQPTFLLAEPLRLAMRGPHPMYQGVLQLLAGPHRVEGGWWHRVVFPDGGMETRHVARDYWVALSVHAGVLWIFQTRLASEGLDVDRDGTAWFLHGTFA